MKLRKLLTIGLLSSTLLTPLNVFAETKTKDITDSEFLEYVEQLKRDNPKLEVVEDEPITVNSTEEARKNLENQKLQLEETKKEVNEKIKEYEEQKRVYDLAVEQYKQDKITYDELWKVYNEQLAKYNVDKAKVEELKAENERLTAEYNTKLAQYNNDLSSYNARNKEIEDVTNRNAKKKQDWQNDVARIEANNKAIKEAYDKKIKEEKEKEAHAFKKYEEQLSDYENFLNNNPSIIDLSERGINLRGNYDETYGYHDKGENTVYKDWWIADNQSGKQGLPDPSQMDFHNYGGATPSKYFANIYTCRSWV